VPVPASSRLHSQYRSLLHQKPKTKLKKKKNNNIESRRKKERNKRKRSRIFSDRFRSIASASSVVPSFPSELTAETDADPSVFGTKKKKKKKKKKKMKGK